MLGYEQLETARDIAAGCATITCELCVTFKDVCTLYTTLMQAKERAARVAVEQRVAAKHDTTCGWAELPSELLEKLLELMQEAAVWRSECKDWWLSPGKTLCCGRCAQAVHDAAVTRLVFKLGMNDKAVIMLVRRSRW